MWNTEPLTCVASMFLEIFRGIRGKKIPGTHKKPCMNCDIFSVRKIKTSDIRARNRENGNISENGKSDAGFFRYSS